jgi:enoyl-CoA hydratase/carnithine racemase
MNGDEGIRADQVRFDRSGNAVTIIIDRPSSRNAISLEVMRRLEQILDVVESDPPVVLSIRGSGDRAFVSGGDLKEFATIRTIEAATEMAVRMRIILDRFSSLPCVTIAEINGHTLGGGGELAIAADIRIAAADARIGFSQIRLGITPAWGGIERLTTLVGRSRAIYLLCSGTALSAACAAQWGLVEEVVDRESFATRTDELRTEIAGYPADAVRTIKAIVADVRPLTNTDTMASAIQGFAAAWVSDAHWAAVEPRQPLGQQK